MNKKIIILIAGILIVLFLCIGATVKQENYFSKKGNNTIVPATGDLPERTELDQGWDEQTRLNFWFTSQGSQIIPYRWFTWLEQSENSELFRSGDHMEMLRYLPIKSSELNPSGLPIGFTISEAKKGEDQWLGLTCAACHTNQLDYSGTKILIEGAPTLANFVLFLDRLAASLKVTSQDQVKFDRFAHKVLADDYNENTTENLKERLIEVTTAVEQRIAVNRLPDNYPKDFTSFGRLDAFGNIQNAGSAFALHDLTNRNPPTAPVSYPFLWGTHQSDVVQWNASAPNTPVVGPLVRNMGEVVGVFGNLSIEKTSWFRRIFGKDRKYSSTVNFHGLGNLESWVKSLMSPAWPENILPAIDMQKASAGKLLFNEHCVSCHQVIERSDEGLSYKAVKTPLADVGTDIAMAWNAKNHQARTLILEGAKSDVLLGKKFGPTTRALEISVDGVIGMVLKHPLEALEAGLKSELASGPKTIEEHVKVNTKERALLEGDQTFGEIESVNSSVPNISDLVYKARPLNGIWATAPYLHNGSVPSLWDLLLMPEDRPTDFWVGSREFNPVKVGYESTRGLNLFKVFDSSGNVRLGNSNRGHVYGAELTNDQKWSLVEYMKTL